MIAKAFAGHDLRSELCWFGATSVGAIGFLLVIGVLDAAASSALSLEKIVLLAFAGGAFVLMGMIAAVAYRVDHERSETANRYASVRLDDTLPTS